MSLSLISLCFVRSIQAQTISTTSQALETLCLECSVSALRNLYYYKKPFTSEFKDNSKEKDVLIILNEDYTQNNYESYVLRSLKQKLNTTKLGHSLTSKLQDNDRFKIFYHLAAGNALDPTKPLWEIEKNNPHDLFGFFAANHSSSVMALNVFQHFEIATTTYLHELFHLYDPYIHKLASKGSYSIVEEFIGEYRAALAELEFVKQRVKFNNNAFIKDIENFDYHNRFFEKNLFGTINHDKIDYEKLYKHLLNTHYPISSESEWVVDTNTPLEIYVEDLLTPKGSIETVNLNSSKISDTMYEILNKYLQTNKVFEPKIIAKVRYIKNENVVVNRKNQQAQAIIKNAIGDDIESFLTQHGLIEIDKLMDKPVEGLIFGPKERGKGD